MIVNHVGLAVADTERSRAFYENVLGFRYWWELDAPDEPTDRLLQLARPIGLHATYLVKDGFVLELLEYRRHALRDAGPRTMDEPGFTHLSMAVDDIAAVLAAAERYGGARVAGTEIVTEVGGVTSAMLRDPDGQLIELILSSWQERLPPMPGPPQP